MPELLKAPRGTLDILPPETLKWLHVERTIRRYADRYGFEEIRTPVFEATELFARGIGPGSDIVSKEMYTFADKRGRSLTLRPELTAPVIRAYLEHQLTHRSLVKWYYIGPGFRYERPQSGRYRQFHQFGVEAVGSPSPLLDAEIIALAVEIFRQLELKNLTVKINSIGCRVCRPAYRENLRKFFSGVLDSMCGDCRGQRFQHNPLRILDCKVPSCREILQKAPPPAGSLCGECRSHFQAVQKWLKVLEIPFGMDPVLVRGLEYYTKTVFEVISSFLGAQNSLCGGGRYDDLAEALGGPPRPAVGFAAGIERIVSVMSAGQVPFPERSIDLYVIGLGEKSEEILFPLVLRLRRGGLRIRQDYNARSFSARMKEADRFHAGWVLILGDNELAKGAGVLRDMRSGCQQAVPVDGLEAAVMSVILASASHPQEAAVSGEVS